MLQNLPSVKKYKYIPLKKKQCLIVFSVSSQLTHYHTTPTFNDPAERAFKIMFSTLPIPNFNFSVTYILLSANALNLDQSKILLFGKEFILFLSSLPTSPFPAPPPPPQKKKKKRKKKKKKTTLLPHNIIMYYKSASYIFLFIVYTYVLHIWIYVF